MFYKKSIYVLIPMLLSSEICASENNNVVAVSLFSAFAIALQVKSAYNANHQDDIKSQQNRYSIEVLPRTQIENDICCNIYKSGYKEVNAILDEDDKVKKLIINDIDVLDAVRSQYKRKRIMLASRVVENKNLRKGA